MKTQCRSTFTVPGSRDVWRCEHPSGHLSVHYSLQRWWPNKHGWPDHVGKLSLGRQLWRKLFWRT